MNPFFHRYHLLRRVAFFFPIQLFLVVLKKNHMMLIFWLIFFGIITQSVAAKYGVPYLFLNPEYMNKVDGWGYLMIGFACGGFIMAFNISSYIMNAFRFPFLATLSNPFFKYVINNCIIPLLFIIVYAINIYKFQVDNQFTSPAEALLFIVMFLLGIAVFTTLSLFYFKKVNKDIYKMFGFENREDVQEPIKKSTKKKPLHLIRKDARDWYVETYVSSFTQLKLARRFDHYKKEMLIKVFKQNHLNASVYEILAVVSLILLGLFKNVPFFELPAGVSIFLLFTMVLMLSSAIHTWLRGWSGTVSILILVLLNQLYAFELIGTGNRAYGLNYQAKKATFSNLVLQEMDKDKARTDKDFNHTIEILNKWRLKNSKNSIEKGERPRLVLLNTSGGGIRSALWTFYALQYADSLLKGQLLNHIQLVTGSSGGMIGAAYMRELYLQKKENKIESFYNTSYVDNISTDLLNPVAFSIATSDLFFRFRKFSDGKYRYTYDRASAFESKLNANTGNVMGKRMIDYYAPETEAQIPMMIFSPTIINDGRKLLISSQPISYLTQSNFSPNVSVHSLTECIEFGRFFEKQDASNLRFTSALRMNATFPYVMPVVTLPSDPEMLVEDAGMRDNYGIETSLKFLYTFRNWISSNTSGVVIIQMRDRHKQFVVEANPPHTIMNNLEAPVGSLYGNIFYTQDFTQDQLLQYAGSWFDGKIDVIDFQLRNEKPDKISLSWHLTNKEKKKVLESVHLPENLEAIEKLRRLLE